MVHPLNNTITVSGTGTLGITSGAILQLGGEGTINTAVDFGPAEGIVHAAVRLNMGGKISGSNGLTKSGPGSLRLRTNTSDYSGQTTVLAGDITYTGDVIPASPGPLGSGTSAIVLAPGGQTNPTGGGIARLWAGGPGTTTFSRDLIVRGNPTGVGGFGTSGLAPNQIVIMNGNIAVDTHLQFQGDPDLPMQINGDIFGPGMLSDGFGSVQQINGFNNNYTGGTDLRGGQWIAGTSGALGTGTIWFDDGGARLSSAADDVELFNPVVFQFGPNINGSKSLILGSILDLTAQTLVHNITNTADTTYAGTVFNGGLIKDGGGLLRLAGFNTYRGGTTVSAGTLAVANSFALGSGSVTVNNGTLRLDPDNSTAYSIAGLSIAVSGKADITNASAIVEYNGASPLPSIMQMINDGRMISSTALPGQTIGLAEASVLFPSGGSFHGLSVDSTMVLLSLTFAGDADLDGDVDVADLGGLATNWQTSAAWTGGDFDHNGTVDVNDLGLLATNWQAGVGTGPSLGEALNSLGLPQVSVPEPTWTLVTLPWPLLRRRRR
jgi:autotransporter-associated beta strand protein